MKKISDLFLKNRIFYLPVYVYLIYFIIWILIFTSGSYSRYFSFVNASDKAYVAGGVINIRSNTSNLEITQQGKGEYTFSVDNGNSQVAIKYDVKITLDNPLPIDVVLEFDGKEISSSDTTYVVENAGILKAGENQIKNHTISFDTQNTANTDYNSKVKITVFAEQIN